MSANVRECLPATLISLNLSGQQHEKPWVTVQTFSGKRLLLPVQWHDLLAQCTRHLADGLRICTCPNGFSVLVQRVGIVTSAGSQAVVIRTADGANHPPVVVSALQIKPVSSLVANRHLRLVPAGAR